ncbi:hypothetical protein H8959_009018 [Pygathrix nigripes]
MAAAGLVAVAAAAEYSGTVASGGNLPGVHCGPSSGAGPGSGPGSWSRSLDRALEEAAVTGVLSLSGRKLREFPRGAANHDLTDTTRADLSRNRLSEIPIEACHFVSLENLNLYQNCIRYIPEAILNLQALTFLNISRNQLSTLPVHLCNLPLKVLIASNNKLVSLPEEIGHLRHLMELDVSCNEIQTIPSQIGNLEALRDLNVRRNHLVHLPEVEHDLDQIDFIDSCTAEEEEAEVRQPKGLDSDSLSSQFVAYIEQRRISHEGSPVKPVAIREFQKTEDMRRYLHQNRVPVEPSSLLSLSASHNQLSHTDLELHRRREQLVERTRREAQLAALQYEEEKIRTKQIQRDAVLDFVKQKASQSPQKQQPLLDGESLSGLNQVGCAAPLPHSSAFTPLKSDDRPNTLLSSPTTETVHHSSAYAFPAAIQRNQPQRPESFLFRAGGRAETNKGHASPLPPSAAPTTGSTDSMTRQNSRQREEELELIDQLRKHIEYRLKVSLPCDLGAALTDGVVLCHLANHVRPRSVPSIHVPSPAVGPVLGHLAFPLPIAND